MYIEKIKELKGGAELIDLSLTLLPLSEKQALFFVGKVFECQRTGNLELETLMKVRQHFYNIASTRLKDNDISDFQNWWKYHTWLLIICRNLE